MLSLYQHSALEGLCEVQVDRDLSCCGVLLEEQKKIRLVRLQGPGDDTVFLKAVDDQIMPLPEPNRVVVTDGWRCAWLAPNEWVFISSEENEDKLIKTLQPACQGKLAMATVISDSRIVISVSGASAVELLSIHSALDLHPSSFLPGYCAVTRFNQVAALIVRTGHRFEIFIDRCYARYIWHLLVDTSSERY